MLKKFQIGVLLLRNEQSKKKNVHSCFEGKPVSDSKTKVY